MVDTSRWLDQANKAAQDPFLLQFLATLGESLDPEGVGGHLGRQAIRTVSSRQASGANTKALADTLTPPGEPGTTSVKRNRDSSLTIQGDYDPVTPAVPRAQQVPDNEILHRDKLPTMSPEVRRRVIARAKQRGVNPITALNMVTYDLANVNEPYLSRYDPDTAVDRLAELLHSEGNENAALVAYRNRPGSPGDPNYLGNVTAYTPYSIRAIDSDANSAQTDVQTMIASREGANATPQHGDEVAKTLEPWTPRQPGADPTVSNDVPRTQGGLVAEDLYGLSPAEQRQIMQTYIENRDVSAEIARELGISQRNLSKARIDAARGIADSGLSPSDRRKLLDVLNVTSDLRGIEAIEIAAANAPPPASAGVDRDAVAAELYGRRYYDLTQTQQGRVNQELSERLAPTAEVVTTEDGVYVVNKRTNRARPVTVSPTGEVPETQESSGTPSQAPRRPPSRTSQLPPTQTAQSGARQTKAPVSSTIDTFINSVSGDPGLPEPGQPLRGKALSETQARSYGYGSRALQAEVISEELEKDETNRARVAGFWSHVINRMERLGRSNTVGYAGGAIATAGPLTAQIVDALQQGTVSSRTASGGLTVTGLRTLSNISRTATRGVLISLVGNMLTSTFAEPAAQALRTPEEQQYAQAKLDFVASLLRKESGAAITAQEYLDADRRYFPQVGDKEPVIAQKRTARQQVIRLLQRESGRPLLPPVRGLVAPAPEPTAPAPPEPLVAPAPPTKRGDTTTPPSVVTRAIGASTGQEIVGGAIDSVLHELMTLNEDELNTFMAKQRIPPQKQGAIRFRIKRLRETP